MKEQLRNIKQRTWHSFKWYPIYGLLKKINEHYPLKDLDALEAFAYTGALQAVAYKDRTRYHEAWEIRKECEFPLKRNLPNAVVKITDSFSEVKVCTKKFNFINVDTHQGLFGNYCEHFDFLPLLFRVMQDECLVILNVIPKADADWISKYPALFNVEHLKRRKDFYGCADPKNVSFEGMMKTYSDLCSKNGYEILWHSFHKRNLMYYLALQLKKTK